LSQDDVAKVVSPAPEGCDDCILISEIPVLDGTTFPFACERTSASDNFSDKSQECTQQQLSNLIETHRPSRRNEKRDPVNGQADPTHYSNYPVTRSYLDNSSTHWHVFTEYAVDELIQENLGGLTYTLHNSSTNTWVRAFHPAEDWNLSNGADDLEHIYSIGRGIVIFRGVSYGNTVQVLHKACPNRDPNHSL